ncbi:MAG TPA: EAL domain-containing protein [Burkholderiaceae bacterium]|nr:EAL domain-containing protein [Burkholderiaceae bacterium]
MNGFYVHARGQRRGWIVVGVSLVLAGALLAAARLFPERLGGAAALALPVALVALGTVAFLLLNVLEQLREQRAIVRRLSELQAQYGVAESLAVLGSWVYDIGEDRYYFSEGAFRVFGLEASQPPPSPKGFFICIHPEDQARWQAAHRRAIKHGREVRIEYRYAKYGADPIWVRSVARPETDRHGRVVRLAGIVQDITTMRAMAQQLAASEAKFRDLTQLSADWVWETDEEHRVSFISDSVVVALGGDWVKQGIGRRRWEGRTIDFPKADWERHRADLAATRPFEGFEFGLLDPEGNVHHVSLSGRPMFDESGRFRGYRGVGRAVTRERQQQLLLQVEGEMASIMREQTEPERVITALIITLCGLMGWSGGAHLVLIPGTRALAVRERWGQPALARMFTQLPAQLQMGRTGVEDRAWTSGEAIWLPDLSQEPEFAARYRSAELGMNAAFLAPIMDEHHNVLSALVFFSPVGFRADALLRQLADILSRTMSLYLQRKNAEKRLMHASLHDALTGLPNRVYLTHQLEETVKRERPAAVLYVDLDRYKLINDTLGHSVGDQVLVEVARRFREALRPTDVAGRIGGDEFILLLLDLTDRDEIERIARKVLAAIERPFVLMNRAYFLSASIGVAVAPDDGRDAQLLIKCADGAMYRVKSEGRNDVRFFAGDLSDERSDQLQLGAEFPLALQRGEVDLYYQPVLAVGERRIVGVEALMRWRHPTRGLLLPEKFLPAAEQSNMTREIGLWAIRRALDDRVSLGLDRFEGVAVSVNISPRQLAEDGFLAQLNALLEERRVPTGMLRLELTENALIENSEKTVTLLAELRRLGIKVIIDNFGTGYASLSYLKNLPVDGLKIDRTFIRGLPEDRGNAAIIQAITTLAGKLGLQAMAEGVETAAEMRALRSFECDSMQGTFISEPLPLGPLRDFLESLPQVRQMHLVKGGDAASTTP